ncbi:hypothetical protein ACJJTC_005367 [Scirpophaga incertulas]
MSKNEYLVLSQGGEPLLTARETGGVSLLASKVRSFEIAVYNTNNEKVIELVRPYTVGADKLRVAVRGHAVGVVRREPTLLKPLLVLHDAGGKPALRVKGPALTEGQCDFNILNPRKQNVGVIRKRWGGVSPAADEDKYQVSFPVDLDLGLKAALIGTCILIDFLYFES